MNIDQLKEQVLSLIDDDDQYFTFITQCLIKKVITMIAYHEYLMSNAECRAEHVSQLFDTIKNQSDN